MSEQAHAPSPANGPKRGMAAPGSCVPMLSLQRLWFARHHQTCICTLKARRVKGTRKLSPAQTAIFCSYGHLVEFDTYLSSQALYGIDLEGKSPEFRRARLEGANRERRARLAALVRLGFRCSNHTILANEQLCVSCTNSGTTSNRIHCQTIDYPFTNQKPWRTQ